MTQDIDRDYPRGSEVDEDENPFFCASPACNNYTDGLKSHCRTCIEDAIGDAKYHARKDGE